MEAGLLLLTTLAASPLAMLACHVAASRLCPRALRQRVALRGIACGAAVVLALARCALPWPADPREWAAAWLYCLAVCAGLGVTYFHFFNMSETARRIRMLGEIARAGSLGADEIECLYGHRTVIRNRLARLVEAGQLVQEGPSYRLGSRRLWTAARAVEAWRRALGLQEPETTTTADRQKEP